MSRVVYRLHGHTIRFTVWASGKQNSVLVDVVPESRLPFVQTSFIYRKTAAKTLRAYVSKYRPEVYKSEKSKILRKIHKVALGKLLT